MSRIIMAWELGGHSGHLSMLLPLARLLQKRGHEILFAVKELGIAKQLFGGERFAYVQAPLSRNAPKAFSKPVSYAGILAEAGFADKHALAGLTSSWRTLFDLFRPDALVSQYAPSAQLAARFAGIPCLRLDTGFEHPPDTVPFPCFRPWLGLTDDDLLAQEKTILENINAVSAQLGVSTSASMQGALRADISLLATLPELDHYRGRGGGRYIGPLFITEEGDEVSWPKRRGPKIFVYLTPFNGLPTVLKALGESKANVVVYVRGMDAGLCDEHKGGRLVICNEKARLSVLLPEMDLAVSHGNHGFVAATLLAGAPMLSIPITIEQWMMSGNLLRIGSGQWIKPDKIATDLLPAVNRMLGETAYREKAKAIADKYSGYDQSRVYERLANTMERMIHKTIIQDTSNENKKEF